MQNSPPPRTPFQNQLLRHGSTWRARHADGRNHPFLADWRDGIYPPVREAAQATVEEIEPHPMLPAVTSSMGFAFNLFLPLRADGPRQALGDVLGQHVGVRFEVDRIQLEWVPPGGLLGELAGELKTKGEHATGVDVVAWGKSDGAPAAFLIEVKLTEDRFTHCGGAASPRNTRKDLCGSADAFLEASEDCYLRRPAHAQRDRRYWEIFATAHGSMRAAFPGAGGAGDGCPFRENANQPMRNLAVAHAMKQAGLVRHAWHGLCVHDGNPDVPTHWAQWQAMLQPGESAPLLRASELLQAGESAGLGHWAEWMRGRYQL